MQRFISNAKNECKDCNKSLEECTCIENTINFKQETLEEASERLNYYVLNGRTPFNNGFKKGANWQSEKMYSEEEVLKLLNDYHKAAFAYTRASSASPKEWFEQFKKK